jgi:hypothetical protein
MATTRSARKAVSFDCLFAGGAPGVSLRQANAAILERDGLDLLAATKWEVRVR